MLIMMIAALWTAITVAPWAVVLAWGVVLVRLDRASRGQG
jgi:hypothetical protein